MPSLIEIGPVVLEKKMKMWKVYNDNNHNNDNNDNDDEATDKLWSEKLIWAYSSGELKKGGGVNIFQFPFLK